MILLAVNRIPVAVFWEKNFPATTLFTYFPTEAQ
jgi:hypothetical protein